MKSLLSGGKINNDQILEWVEADPSLVLFKGTYYLFPSMTAGFFTSNDLVEWETTDAAGVNILWGYAPDKLYHSCLVYGKTSQKIGALVKGEPVYVRVDTFNEVGITEGETQKAR